MSSPETEPFREVPGEERVAFKKNSGSVNVSLRSELANIEEGVFRELCEENREVTRVCG